MVFATDSAMSTRKQVPGVGGYVSPAPVCKQSISLDKIDRLVR
jgi:hypothetical protein